MVAQGGLTTVILSFFFFLISESEVSESEGENERNFQFDFLIDGIYLQETLDKHMRLYNISTVSIQHTLYLAITNSRIFLIS